jgi:hypothetical protein
MQGQTPIVFVGDDPFTPTRDADFAFVVMASAFALVAQTIFGGWD